jgi:hypothetical protein
MKATPYTQRAKSASVEPSERPSPKLEAVAIFGLFKTGVLTQAQAIDLINIPAPERRLLEVFALGAGTGDRQMVFQAVQFRVRVLKKFLELVSAVGPEVQQ